MGAGNGLERAASSGEALALIREEFSTDTFATTLAEALTEIRRLTRQLKAERDQYERLATTDHVTGLANRRCFDDRLDQCAREARRGRPVSLVIADVDHFKKYNDAHGHQAGDDILAAVAIALRMSVRETDIVARTGGEEFGIILTGTDHEGAMVAAEKMRFAVESIPGTAVTASFGVCSWVQGMTPADMVKAADRALYVAKRNGRNQVRSSTEPVELGDGGLG